MYKIISFTVILFFILILPAQAFVSLNSIYLDQATVEKGYTVHSADEQYLMGFLGGALVEPTRIEIKQLDNNNFQYPDGWEPVTDVYEFDVKNKKAVTGEKYFYFRFNTGEVDNLKNITKVFFYNGVDDQWVPLPIRCKSENTIDSLIFLPYAKMIVLQNTGLMSMGKASWYAYKGCDCAASPDYEKGTVLRVTNTENNKFVDVTVNDYGPDRAVHPQRVIDLDKVAFQKLAPLWQGIIPEVRVEVVGNE